LGQTLNYYTRNFYYTEGTAEGCTVTTPVTNTLEITTPAGDAGGRTYTMVFYPYLATPYTLEKTAGADLTDNFVAGVIKYLNIIQN
jgi:hypothetical protein